MESRSRAEASGYPADLSSACIPGSLAIAVALHLPPRIAGAMRSAGAGFNFGFHQPFGCEGQHRPYQITIGAPSTNSISAILSSVIAVSVQGFKLATRTLAGTPTMAARP